MRMWTDILWMVKQFLLHMWHLSYYPCYKPGNKSWMRKGPNCDYDKHNIFMVICDRFHNGVFPWRRFGYVKIAFWLHVHVKYNLLNKMTLRSREKSTFPICIHGICDILLHLNWGNIFSFVLGNFSSVQVLFERLHSTFNINCVRWLCFTNREGLMNGYWCTMYL